MDSHMLHSGTAEPENPGEATGGTADRGREKKVRGHICQNCRGADTGENELSSYQRLSQPVYCYTSVLFLQKLLHGLPFVIRIILHTYCGKRSAFQLQNQKCQL